MELWSIFFAVVMFLVASVAIAISIRYPLQTVLKKRARVSNPPALIWCLWHEIQLCDANHGWASMIIMFSLGVYCADILIVMMIIWLWFV